VRVAMMAWETLHSLHVGGLGVHVTELAAALSRKGHEVHVFTRCTQGRLPYEFIDGVHYHRCAFQLHPDFVTEINHMCDSLVNHLWATEDYIGPFDLVHAHDWMTSNAAVWAKQGRGKRAVVTFHSTEFGRCGNQYHDGNSSRIRDHERHGTYCADRVIAVSHALKRELMQMYQVPDWKTHVVYNGVSCHNYDGFIDCAAVKARYGIGPMDPTVLFAGRLTYQKGPDILLEAIPTILHGWGHAKFVFVGDGDMRAGLEHRAWELGIQHATRFLGYRNGGELRDLFRACDIVCVPSRNEPFGIVILEAWAAGKPVVATARGGPAEFVWHEVNGLRVYDNPQSVVWGLQRLMSDWGYCRWLGHNGRIAVESVFNWDVVADRVLEVYSQAF